MIPSGTNAAEVEQFVADLVRPGDAAHALGVSTAMIHKWADDGRLHVVRTPLGRLVLPDSLRELAGRRGVLL